MSKTHRSVFYSRPMDGIDKELLLAQDGLLNDLLSRYDLYISNPFEPQAPERERISGIGEIVERDLRALEKSEILIADLSCYDRPYIGVVFELCHAYKLGVPIYVWVGDSGLQERTWLRYYADAICKDLKEIESIIRLCHTSRGYLERRRNLTEYYDSIAEQYCLKESLATSMAGNPGVIERYMAEKEAIRAWIEKIQIDGVILDLGCGTAQWAEVWSDQARHAIFVDQSSKMLKTAENCRLSCSVEYIKGDFMDDLWLTELLSQHPQIDFVFLGFVLNMLTISEEKSLLRRLHLATHPHAQLLILENQSSLFSMTNWYSRVEVQNRKIAGSDREWWLLKRNFLAKDLQRSMAEFGHIVDICSTENYFVGGLCTKWPSPEKVEG